MQIVYGRARTPKTEVRQIFGGPSGGLQAAIDAVAMPDLQMLCVKQQ